MRIIADLHIHSRYSRATSKEMEVETLAKWAGFKGIDILGTGDFTHPAYFSQLKEKLEPVEGGLFRLKGGNNSVRFMITGEVSNIFSQGGRVRKIHTLIFVPSFAVAEKINLRLAKFGKLASDGRPVFGFPVKELVKIVTDVSQECLLVPAHAWTPWFSIFGAASGFDSIEECFQEESGHIFALETGLSSDPQMNWRLSALDKICLLSNSDAHSPSRIGREANVFDLPLDYAMILNAIRNRDKKNFLYTLEFFPEEGKYHYDGHRNCGVLSSPAESRKNKNLCPVCGRSLTLGVMHRVESLADRKEGFIPGGAIPAKHLVPLEEIIAEVLGQAVGTKAVQAEYYRLISVLGPEFKILLDVPLEELARAASSQICEAIARVRQGKVNIVPGYDGVYGKVTILGKRPQEEKQFSLF